MDKYLSFILSYYINARPLKKQTGTDKERLLLSIFHEGLALCSVLLDVGFCGEPLASVCS